MKVAVAAVVGVVVTVVVAVVWPTLRLTFYLPVGVATGLVVALIVGVLLAVSGVRRSAAAQRRRQDAAFAAGADAERVTLSQQRNQFLGRLDHELKNPMTALRIALSNANSELLSEGAETSLALAGAQMERIERLLSDVRKLAELETARLDLSIVEPAELLHELVDSVRSAYPLRAADLRLVVQGVPRPLPAARVDPDLIFLALYNLVSNAVKFSEVGDLVEIRASEEKSEDDTWLRIEIADSGPGIPEHELVHIWEELRRGSNSASVEGSGIGLSIARVVIERHSGRVTAHSLLGQGSVFTVRVPLRPT